MKIYDSSVVQHKAPDDGIYKVRNDILGCLEWWMHMDTAPHNYGAVLHREDGPAVMFDDGSMEWYFRGELHRTDGPALTFIDELNCPGFGWSVNGKYILSYEEFQHLTECSDEDIVFFKVRYGEMT
jgi:hypothetical protein